jgi:hypothetical protein
LSEPLGIRYNNPWNLQQEHIAWIGLTAEQSLSGELQFDTMIDGIRAGVLLCYTYERRGINTPALFIPVFSPAKAGNPTEQYLVNVCTWGPYKPDQRLDFHDGQTMAGWAKAIWRQEQGLDAMLSIQPYLIAAGIDAAEGE